MILIFIASAAAPGDKIIFCLADIILGDNVKYGDDMNIYYEVLCMNVHVCVE